MKNPISTFRECRHKLHIASSVPLHMFQFLDASYSTVICTYTLLHTERHYIIVDNKMNFGAKPPGFRT